MSEPVWILGGLRSFIGVKNGIYCRIPAEILGAEVLKELKKRLALNDTDIDLIIGGNAVAGGGNITRLAALEAGICRQVPAMTIDLQCASALTAVSTAAARIRSGMADLVIAGGLESVSTQPLLSFNPNHPLYESGTYTTSRFSTGKRDEQAMIRGAERTALTAHISKTDMDPWIRKSHNRAAVAKRQGLLSDVQLSIAGSNRDEGVREHMSQRLLDRLPYLLPDGQSITAGNACLMNDGAAFVALCSDRWLRTHNRSAAFCFCCDVLCGGDPDQSPRCAPLAIHRLLEQNSLNYRQIDAFEVNEAFAVIDVLFAREFPGMEDCYNIFGGALAYGHPYGASGAILLLHLMEALKLRRGRFGICCAAAAGGIGDAFLIERVFDQTNF